MPGAWRGRRGGRHESRPGAARPGRTNIGEYSGSGEFVCTARRYPTVQIRVGQHALTAEDPLPPDLRDARALVK